MRRVALFLLFVGLICSIPAFAQKKRGGEGHKENASPFGRKKKEKKNQRAFRHRGGGLFSRKASAGNADQFAGNRISGKKSFLASIFGNRANHNASLRKTKPTRKNEDSKLFKRNRTNAKHNHEGRQTKQNRKREKTRKRGNDVFSRKKR